MSNRQKIFLLILTILFIAFGVATIAIYFLYQAALEEQKNRLREIVDNRALIIEVIARSYKESNKKNSDGLLASILKEINQVPHQFSGFGETGEFLLAELKGKQIHFLLAHRNKEERPSMPFHKKEFDAPMKFALLGKSGIRIGTDCWGKMVMAAYRPIKEIKLGLVAKIDMAEIQKPFNRAVLFFGIGALLLGLLGIILARMLTYPLIQKLENNEARLNLILENAADGIITINQYGTIESINSAAINMFGFSREESLGRNVSFLMPNPYREEHDGYLQNYLETGEKKIIGIGREVLGQRKDHTVFPMELSVGESRLGDRITFSGIVRDITERKQTEEERKHLIKELESKNAELERFTYTASHDLRVLLITIKGFLGLLEKDALKGNEERMKSDIKHISSAVQKMQQLLEDLLELSRIGRLVNPPCSVSLKKVIAEALELVTGQLQEKKVQVQVESELPFVFGDYSRLVEVFQNLIDNAVKFMDNQEKPAIKIGAHQENELILCFVQDNGLGIEQRYQQKVFGLFERLNQKIDGTGIGLALVKRIIEVHGGKIWVESEGKGRGTTFKFHLPHSEESGFDNG